jgi:hypothetical protein
MATVTLTIPDQHVQRVISAVCAAGPIMFGGNLSGATVTPSAAAAKQIIIDWITECVRQAEHQAAMSAISIDTAGVVA